MLNYILSVEQVEGAVQMLIACVVNIDWRLKPRAKVKDLSIHDCMGMSKFYPMNLLLPFVYKFCV